MDEILTRLTVTLARDCEVVLFRGDDKEKVALRLQNIVWNTVQIVLLSYSYVD